MADERVLGREVLEPRLSLEQRRERTLQSMLHPKPDITRVSRSSVLDQVRTFLPRMAEAESQLNKALREGLADSFNIQNVDNDDRVVEMDVALLKEDEKSWTSDSEPDSTPSQTMNDFTSDSDISSSSPCSSSSVSADEDDDQSDRNDSHRYSACSDPQPPTSRKRPLVEEIESPASPKFRRDQS